jgi:hypothetical protein
LNSQGIYQSSRNEKPVIQEGDHITIAPDSLQGKEGLYTLHTTDTSLLENHLHQPGANGWATQRDAGFDWVFIVTVLIMLIVTLVRYFTPKRFTLILSTVLSRSHANHYLRDSNVFREQIFLPLLLSGFIATGLYIFILWKRVAPDGLPFHPVLFFGMIVLGYALFFLLKILLLYISGEIFKNHDVTFEYIHNLFVFNLFTSITLLPFLLMIPYFNSSFLVYLSLGAILTLFAVRFFRGVAIGSGGSKFSLFHLFLYLCTLEILPYIVLAKFALKYIFAGA